MGLSETNALRLSHLLRTQDKHLCCREQLGLQLDGRVSSCGPLSLQLGFLLVLTVHFQN